MNNFNQEIFINFGTKLRHYRLQKGYSQLALANSLGWHRSYLGATERGLRNISFIKLMQISKALDIKPEMLVSDI